MKDNSGKILLAMIAGASAGVIAGLLMAPDNGVNTRGNLKKQASKLTKDLEKTFQDGMKSLEGVSSGWLARRNGESTTNQAGNDSSAQQKGVQGTTASAGSGTSGASGSGSTPGM